MPYLAAAVANSFLNIAKSEGGLVDPMKVQKLVYFAHGWHLGFERGALSAEYAQAWRWGPVFPKLYGAVKIWGSEPIMDSVSAMEINHSKFRWSTPSIPSEDTFAMELTERVWKVYGHMSGPALSQLTHEPDGPWDVIRKKNPALRNQVIPNHLIQKNFYQKIRLNAEERTRS